MARKVVAVLEQPALLNLKYFIWGNGYGFSFQDGPSPETPKIVCVRQASSSVSEERFKELLETPRFAATLRNVEIVED